MYAVHDAGDGTSGNESFLGYMHLDLEPRENKYGHAAVWGLIPGYEKAEYAVSPLYSNSIADLLFAAVRVTTPSSRWSPTSRKLRRLDLRS